MSKREYIDVPYGTNERQKLDLYLPKKPAKSVMIFWHGGSWVSGKKSNYRTIAKSLRRLGIAVVTPNYRLYPEGKWKDFLADGASATAWVQYNIENYGVKKPKIILAGHSAGAYIAAMLASDTSYLQNAGVKLNNIKALIGISGPYDFYPKIKLRPIFSLTDKAKKWLPIIHAKNVKIPVLLLHGQKDKIVAPSNATNFAQELKSNKVKVDLKMYTTVKHFLIITSVLRGFWWLAPARRDIKKFLKSNKLI